LDAKLRSDMRSELVKLHKRLEGTFVYVTHDQTEAMTMGDRIVVMADGVVQQVDTPQTLYNRPANVFVAGFIGSPQMNMLSAVLHRKGSAWWLDLSGAALELPAGRFTGALAGHEGKTLTLGIRPEDIHEAASSAGAGQSLATAVEVLEQLGSEAHAHLDYKGAKIIARLGADTPLKAGGAARVSLDMGKAHLFDPEDGTSLLSPA
jgi:multiple sugar transport system ATP-binding protein